MQAHGILNNNLFLYVMRELVNRFRKRLLTQTESGQWVAAVDIKCSLSEIESFSIAFVVLMC